jgi:hypothetical protein
VSLGGTVDCVGAGTHCDVGTYALDLRYQFGREGR